MISHIISTLISCLVAYLLIVQVPAWLKIDGIFALIVRIIGVLILILALLSWT